MSSILETHALSRKFGELIAVNAVDIMVAQGEIYGLLGRNGAGKTTLIKMLTTLLPASSGTATINGYDMASQAAQIRRILGYVPQGLSADGELTGAENLQLFACLYDIPPRDIKPLVRQSLDFMGLAEAADVLVKTYSGGMIRRLEIAQSMLHRPPLLFLDEPTIGLDPVAREIVWKHINQLQQEFGTTIFLTTHYMEEAEKLCNRIAIMRQGAIVTTGTLQELKLDSKLTTLEDIFAFYTSDANENDISESMSGYRETSNTRRTARRLS